MNLEMMRECRPMATDGDHMNDKMTREAIAYMESQIQDPELRERVRPHSKCKFVLDRRAEDVDIPFRC